MNLHTLASYAGHDVQTMQRYYAHVIARYRNAQPIDLDTECTAAWQKVLNEPFEPVERPPGPQRDAHRPHRRAGLSMRRRQCGEWMRFAPGLRTFRNAQQDSNLRPTPLGGLSGGRRSDAAEHKRPAN